MLHSPYGDVCKKTKQPDTQSVAGIISSKGEKLTYLPSDDRWEREVRSGGKTPVQGKESFEHIEYAVNHEASLEVASAS